jgi:hypothetical protein
MSLTAQRPPKLKPGPLTTNRIRGALHKADDAQLLTLRELSGEQLARNIQLNSAIEAEVDRRHWPGHMTGGPRAA